MKIYAPVKDANGVYASVRFINGVGETDNPRLIEWFKSHGYNVSIEDESNVVDESLNSIIEPQNDVIEDDDDEVEMMGYTEKIPSLEELEQMSPYDLREWMLAHGYNVRNTRNKEKLLEIIRG